MNKNPHGQWFPQHQEAPNTPSSPHPLSQRIFRTYPGCNIRPKRNLRRYCTCGPMLYVMSEAAEVASDAIDMAVLASGSG